MFNNIFCEMNIKKVIHWGGPGGMVGTALISSWKCNFSICLDIQVYYLDIQTITILLCLLLVLCVGSFYSLIFISYNRSPEQWRFLALKSLLLPQFSTYRHQTGFIVKRKQVCIQEGLWQNYKLQSFFFFTNF